MGEVVQFLTKAERRVEALCKATSVNAGLLNDGESEALLGSVVIRLDGENIHRSADEAEEIACGILKAVREAREER